MISAFRGEWAGDNGQRHKVANIFSTGNLLTTIHGK